MNNIAFWVVIWVLGLMFLYRITDKHQLVINLLAGMPYLQLHVSDSIKDDKDLVLEAMLQNEDRKSVV